MQLDNNASLEETKKKNEKKFIDETIPTSISVKIVIFHLKKFFFLALLICVPILVIKIDMVVLKNDFSETSMTEFTQEGMLFLIVLSFSYIAVIEQELRHFAVLLAGFFGCMLIREFDGVFDLISHGFWVYPAVLTAICAICYACLDLKQTIAVFGRFVQNPNFVSLCLGMALLVVFSRLFGMGSLWKGILGDDYTRIVKHVAEEGLEMLGYTVIFYSVMHYLLDVIRFRKSDKDAIW